MAASPVRYLNKVFLKGRLGRDPELRRMPSGDPVCNFSIATRSGKHVEWHKVVAYDGLAEYVKEAFSTGDFVYIEAEIRTREFQTAEDRANNRKPRKVLELIAGEAHLIAKRAEHGAAAEDDLPGGGDSDALGAVVAGNDAGESVGSDSVSFALPKYI